MDVFRVLAADGAACVIQSLESLQILVERYMQNSELVIIPVLALHRCHLDAVTPAPPPFRQVSLHGRRNEFRHGVFAPRLRWAQCPTSQSLHCPGPLERVVKREVVGNESQKVRRRYKC